ncbi:50S ribosomal protein L37ae [Candidatus Nanohalobium constans]|uniref:Large ribosomal subunit protein eL43 n=1 Tax=Candidatus Nanohalobium constans TaxID=2565781 RepID=A0A5Q0UFT1_9ARCH|nr:50S ribosomal protein L37ae [Candidatus Nanohalobium constans]QGA80458.1 50S ribosomal protein L37Ae [Candidatus Nanohalobium constans]
MAQTSGSSKRFGARYGNRIRKNVDEAESRDEECPECGADLERNAAGIWQCTKCGQKFTGGSYEFDTGARERLQKALELEEGFEELEEAKEEIEG